MHLSACSLAQEQNTNGKHAVCDHVKKKGSEPKKISEKESLNI
jgi:hypothetical protein